MEQRLKGAAVDKGDLHQKVGQPRGGVQGGKASANDDKRWRRDAMGSAGVG